jgi:NADH-quinone oxidoreductase subunit N
VGFILLGLISYDSFFGVRAVIFYIFSYLSSITILFAIISYAFNNATGEIITINDLITFCKLHINGATFITFMLFSLAGLPPFIGFFSKYFILLSLFESDLSITLFFFFLFNTFSIYYYVRLVQVI